MGEIFLGGSCICLILTSAWREYIFIFLCLCLTLYARYKPGDIVIFRSPYLFHAIGPWMPGRMGPNDTCTPGRVSWVHFTHADVHEKLQGKKEGYFLSGGFTGVGVTKADHYE